MSEPVLKCLLISDFTINPLDTYLKKSFAGLNIKCKTAPIDQVRQTLLNVAMNNEEYDIIAVWTKPEKQIHEFQKLCISNNMQIDKVMDEVTEYSQALKMASEYAKLMVVPTWSLPGYYRGNGVLDLKNSCGIKNTLMRMNLKLADTLEEKNNIYLLDSDKWFIGIDNPDDDKMWYMGKIPFTRDVFLNAANEIKAVADAAWGRTRKLIVVDLDNTLWGGIIGDDGMEGIKLGGIDPIGEAFVEFQKSLLALKNRGILLAVSSKNEQSIAMNAIDQHPEMVLRSHDFVDSRINWEDKAQNIEQMVKSLNIGLQSVVFIDDNPAERDRVAKALPEVFVPDWPCEPIYYKRALNSLRCFDSAHYSEEDSDRTKLYHQEQKRQQFMSTIESVDKWLAQMELKLFCEPVSEKNIQRAAQLVNKTNQFNLITRRMEQSEFLGYCMRDNVTGLVFRAEDKFGDYGLIGVCTFKYEDEHIEIEDFVLSCRAMGRGVEKSILYMIKEYAAQSGKKLICASYIPTQKNKPCEEFLPDNGFVKEREIYLHNSIDSIKNPDHIDIFFPDDLKAQTAVS